MLVLSRKKGETIIINDNIEITVLDINGPQIRIGISAPKDVSIVRKEIYQAVQNENKNALEQKGLSIEMLGEMIKKEKK